MGNFLTYKDVPVFANFENENRDVGTSTSPSIFAATEASISLNANLTPNRYLGKTQTRNDFSTNGPLEARISMTFFPIIETWETSDLNISRANQLAFFNTTGQFTLGHSIQIGSYFFYRVYLQNYSMKINAFQPVSVTANFIAYDLDNVVGNAFNKFSGPYLPISKTPNIPYYKALHAITTVMEGSEAYLPSAKTSIQVNVDCQRTPIYNIGNKIPSTVVLNTVERTTTVEGEGIGNAVNLNGTNAGSTNIYFLPFSHLSTTPSEFAWMLKFDINGRIVSQDISTSQNGLVNGRVVIKEIIL